MLSAAPPHSLFFAGVRRQTAGKREEHERADFSPAKVAKGRVAWRDIQRIESLARRKSQLITKEMIEKNIEPRSAKASPRSEETGEDQKTVSEYELWLVKKDFEAKIKKDLIEEILQEYELEQRKQQEVDKEA